ncbi:hypothetical protein VNO77_44857 [Canavalia gladiata]|uniref:Uncharacterized protein n=1 Tax=Canavalia gladiata TaxID=3824 RepID=A0AAN9JXG1_CANGL
MGDMIALEANSDMEGGKVTSTNVHKEAEAIWKIGKTFGVKAKGKEKETKANSFSMMEDKAIWNNKDVKWRSTVAKVNDIDRLDEEKGITDANISKKTKCVVEFWRDALHGLLLEGVWMEEPKVLKEEVKNFFKSRFKDEE